MPPFACPCPWLELAAFHLLVLRLEPRAGLGVGGCRRRTAHGSSSTRITEMQMQGVSEYALCVCVCCKAIPLSCCCHDAARSQITLHTPRVPLVRVRDLCFGMRLDSSVSSADRGLQSFVSQASCHNLGDSEPTTHQSLLHKLELAWKS